MLSFQGKFWKIPAGDTPWPLETTAKWGKGVENGILKSVGVVPKPLQKPHPPIFQPFAQLGELDPLVRQERRHRRSCRRCTRSTSAICSSVYAAVSGTPKPGEGMGMLRDIIIADTDEEATAAVGRIRRQFAGNAWFVPFGFRRGMLDPKTGEAPTPEEAIAKGYASSARSTP